MWEKLLKTRNELKKSESQRLYYVGIIKENEQTINRLEEGNNKLKAEKEKLNKELIEEEKQSEESSMTNRELILVIESLIGTLNEINLPQFKGLKSKNYY